MAKGDPAARTAPESLRPDKELRIALVCYGGVSLAVYMHGVTKELWKLIRASEAHNAGRAAVSMARGDTEGVWYAMLAEIGRQTSLSVMIDILAGASAGGLNAILLSNALAQGQSLEPLTNMWLEEADVDHLLDPDARPRTTVLSRLSRFYKEPVAWFAGRHSAALAAVDEPDVRAEITLKLAHFVRARWFKPPFSGRGLTAMLDRAMDAMAAVPGPVLVPPTVPLSLFVTATDYWGRRAELNIHSPPVVVEREHRRLFHFESPTLALAPGADMSISPPVLLRNQRRQPVGDRPALLLAARATTSFPGAFPPATIGEIDNYLERHGRDWPGRADFVARQLAGDRPAEEIALIDGSVLNNAPFGAAIAAVRHRHAYREVARRFIYIDPTPDLEKHKASPADRKPNFFNTIFRSMADIPREQPIRESLAEISALSIRSQRLRNVVEALPASIDTEILRAVGAAFFRRPVSLERLARARSRIQSAAARSAGFAFAAYAQLKLQLVLDGATRLIGEAIDLDNQHCKLLREVLELAARSRGAFDHRAATGSDPDASGYVRLLRQLDIDYRIRRLRFFISRVSDAMGRSLTMPEREAAETLKARLYRAVAPFEICRASLSAEQAAQMTTLAAGLTKATTSAEQAELGGRLIDALSGMLDLSNRDRLVDRMLVDTARDLRVQGPTRQELVRAWLGFPFYDVVILPLMHDQQLHGFDELLVDRISPEDTSALMPGDSRTSLKGWQLSAFAAFFSRAYRENDYLWGRLNAAERLVDIVASAVPTVTLDSNLWKTRLFRAILASERERLTRVPALLDDLEQRIDNFADGVPNEAPKAPDS